MQIRLRVGEGCAETASVDRIHRLTQSQLSDFKRMSCHAPVNQLSSSRRVSCDYEFLYSSALRIEKPQQCLVIRLTEPSTHAHVPGDSAGNLRRESLRRVVASGAVLIEHLLSAIWLRCGNGFRLRLGTRLRRGVLCLAYERYRSEQQKSKHYCSRVLHRFPSTHETLTQSDWSGSGEIKNLSLLEKKLIFRTFDGRCISHKLTPPGQRHVTQGSKVCHSIVSAVASSYQDEGFSQRQD